MPAAKSNAFRKLLENFNPETAPEIKQFESVTNNDVKALEYYMKKEMDKLGLEELKEFIHFGLTSQDVNNTAIPLMRKEAFEYEFYPAVSNLIIAIRDMAKSWSGIPMLARTHGQPASPTTLGKEMMVFVERLENQLNLLNQVPYSCKFGGTTGNLNANAVAYPKINWVVFANNFCNNRLGLQRQQYTTQIENYDLKAAHFDELKRINTTLIDFCRDIWTYIPMEYFRQKTKVGEIGSSEMPQ